MVDKLKSIGFYTLEDARAARCSCVSPLWRCELLVTSRCNFRCPYCRKRGAPDLTREEAISILNEWFMGDLQNVRISGGEPTLWPYLTEMVGLCKDAGVKHIAISTNGSADFELYLGLLKAGVNDFSISLDACCADTGELMMGHAKGVSWDNVVSNIRKLSLLTYVTVGVVITEANLSETEDIIKFAHDLGVDDIRLVPAAQESRFLPHLNVGEDILEAHPVLKYRITNILAERSIRGILEEDNHRCPLVLDDMAVESGKHYPCIIHLRERGEPIGKVGPMMREERANWFQNHDCFADPICNKNCLDVCVDYNNRVTELNKL
ncbi:MAG: radical SAM protein [Firmicutes bacterium]|nr:radical SAM protein [Bacillota bacterium]